MERNREFDDPHIAFEAIKSSIEECRNTTGRDTAVVAFGGLDSLVSLFAACDVYGPHKVLAVGVYSVFSNSRMPAILQSVAETMPISFCTIDATETMQEMMNANIGLRRIEIERMHFSMDEWQKAELMISARNSIMRGVAIRHQSTHIESHDLSKIVGGWVMPMIFDWNPVHMLTRRQLSVIANRRCDEDEILSLKSGLDVWIDGGPHPTAVNIDVDLQDPQTSPKPNVTNFIRVGLGIHQPEKI